SPCPRAPDRASNRLRSWSPHFARSAGTATCRWAFGALQVDHSAEAVLAVVDDDHLEAPRAVDALDPLQLDVAGGRRPADPGERRRRRQPSQGLGHAADHLAGHHYADVEV